MPKRFTDTEKWKDAWFTDLPSKYKLLWIFLLDDCNHAGIWKVNFKNACFFVGESLEPAEVKRILGDRLKVVSDEYWFLPKFITFQYGILGESIPHQSVIKELEKQGLAKGYQTPKDKDKDKEVDKDKDCTERGKKFAEKLVPFVETYGKEMIRAFFDYWTEKNDDGHKMRFEMERVFAISKRLIKWKKNNFENIKPKSNQPAPTTPPPSAIADPDRFNKYDRDAPAQ